MRRLGETVVIRSIIGDVPILGKGQVGLVIGLFIAMRVQGLSS